MPMYLYRCPTCGHEQGHEQKMLDAKLTHCPACGAEGYYRKPARTSFVLKGSWAKQRYG